jgi:hypothetical protein
VCRITKRKQVLVAILRLADSRADHPHERMLTQPLLSTGDCGHDVESRDTAGAGDAALMLAQEARQHCGEPDLKTRPDAGILTVLVMP